MDKFSYRNYDSTIEETVFSSSAGYSDPVNEAETRKQFSYPLYEIKTHLNNTCNIDSADKQVQLKVETANNNILKFSEDGTTWSNVTISADVPVVVEGTVPRGGDEGQVLIKSTNGDYDMEWTDYNNLEAGSGINISNNIIGHSNSVGAQNVQAVYPIKIDSEGHISQYGSAVTSFTPSAHTHGNISNTGDITTTATIASGDRLVINDESASKVTNSSITFGTSTTSYLANNGTWRTPKVNIPSGVNLTNVLATITTSSAWTATADCYIRTWNQGKYGNGYIAGVHIASGTNDSHEGFIPVKKGTVIQKSSEGTWTAYGVATTSISCT